MGDGLLGSEIPSPDSSGPASMISRGETHRKGSATSESSAEPWCSFTGLILSRAQAGAKGLFRRCRRHELGELQG
jgi:hypothetical protein